MGIFRCFKGKNEGNVVAKKSLLANQLCLGFLGWIEGGESLSLWCCTLGCVPEHPKAAPCPSALHSHPLGSLLVFASWETSWDWSWCRRTRRVWEFLSQKIERKRPPGEFRRTKNSCGSPNPVGFASVGWSDLDMKGFVFPNVPWESWMGARLGRAAGSGNSR